MIIKKVAIGVVLMLTVIPNLLAQHPVPEPTVARLLELDGDMLASTKTGLISVAKGAEFTNGTRVMTLAKSNGTIEYIDGCILKLEPNMRAEIKLGVLCEERQNLALRTVLDPASELVLETPTASIPALILGGSLGGPAIITGAGVASIVRNNSSDSVSPN